MKKVSCILVIVLLLLSLTGCFRRNQEPEIIQPVIVTTQPSTTGSQQTSGAAVTTGNSGSGILLEDGTGKIDDTVLPLDTQTGTSDPEVEEIVNLLEELIEGSEQ